MARECRWGAFLLLMSLAAACSNSAPPTSPSGGPSEQVLVVTVTGAGAVVSTPGGINCDEGESQRRGPLCSASFAQGTSVALTANAAAGSVFAGWDGGCTGQGACAVTMSAAVSVTAHFTASPPPPPPPSTFAVTVAKHGSGAVRSTPAGIDCGQTCSATFVTGAQVVLSASPDAGWKFSGWSGACSGTRDCTLAADASVSAQFDQLPPPPPGTHSLSVTAQGQGSVSSSPAGISCDGGESQRRGSTCNATFSDGAQVQLTATPASGWQFSGFSGACSGQSCSVAMSADRSASAAFTQIPPPPPPPPPVDECAGLVPTSLGTAAHVVLPQGPCEGGTSDDGIGNFVLEWTVDSDRSFPGYAFFTVQNGNAVEIGEKSFGSDTGQSYFFSQPSGFTKYSANEFRESRGLDSWSHDGHLGRRNLLTQGSIGAGHAAAVGVDPSGGTVAVVSTKRTGPGWDNAFTRYDPSGGVVTTVAIDDADLKTASSVGIDLAGHVLVLANDTGGSRTVARWFDAYGVPLTGWSPALAANEFNFLMDGSLVTRGGSPLTTHGPAPTNHVLVRYQDGQSTPGAPPDWLQARGANRLYVIRNGKGYASWGAGGSCGGALEVLAVSGKSCGCVNVPDLSPYSTVGRDGSLIVGERAPAPRCGYALYPQLLK